MENFDYKGNMKQKYGGYNQDIAELYRSKYKSKDTKKAGYQAIGSLPPPVGEHIGKMVKTNINTGYYPANDR